MVTINELVNELGPIICAGILVTIVIVVAILGIKARLKGARQIRRYLAEGVHEKWDKAKTNRLRMIALSQMTLLFGLFVWVITAFTNTSEMFSPFRLIVLAFIYTLLFILGFAFNRILVGK